MTAASPVRARQVACPGQILAEVEHYAAEYGVDLRTVELDVASSGSVEAGIAKTSRSKAPPLPACRRLRGGQRKPRQIGGAVNLFPIGQWDRHPLPADALDSISWTRRLFMNS
jgi:hypothetical protein